MIKARDLGLQANTTKSKWYWIIIEDYLITLDNLSMDDNCNYVVHGYFRHEGLVGWSIHG